MAQRITHNIEYDSNEAGWFVEFWLHSDGGKSVELYEESQVYFNKATAHSWSRARAHQLTTEVAAKAEAQASLERVAEWQRIREEVLHWLRKAAKASATSNVRWACRNMATLKRDDMLDFE